MTTRGQAAGRLYEDFEPGQEFEHWPGRTITQADNTWFTLLTMNTHPLHFDEEYAARTRFGRPLVNSCLTLSFVVGMSVSDMSQAAVANLGFDEVRLPAPVHNGDTLYATSTILDKRVSRSDPTVGIVRFKTVGMNQNGVEVISLVRAMLVPLRQQSDQVEGG